MIPGFTGEKDNSILKLYLVILSAVCLCTPALSRLYVQAQAGWSIASPYVYFDARDTTLTHWVDFKARNWAALSGGISADIYKNAAQVGVYSGYLRRYDLVAGDRDSNGTTVSYSIGELVSIPIIAYVQSGVGPISFRFGLGPFVTRFNFTRIDLPQYTVTSLFGYLFGAGYHRPMFKNFELVVDADLVLNSPIKLWEFFPDKVKAEIHNAVYQEYNRYDYVSIIYNFNLSIGVRFAFGNGIGIPLEKAGLEKLAP